MRYLEFFITFLGLLELSYAAPDREKRQTNLVDQCRAIFNVSCDSLGATDNASTLPPLNRDIVTDAGTSDCECVQYYQCSKDGTLNSDGATIIDRRISPCPGILEVCCKAESMITDTGTGSGTGPVTDSGTGPVTGPSTGSGTGAGTSPGTGPGTGGTVTPTPRPTQPPVTIPVKPGCGHRNENGIAVRITGIDNEAQFAEFPWMVAVLQKTETPELPVKYACGGSLIHPRVILTAAHNVEKKKAADLIVRAGEWDTKTQSEPIAHQERQVQQIVMHENYNTNNLHWDFALLMLREGFDLQRVNVAPICLPQETDNFDAVRCLATGWGKDKFDQTGVYQSVLKKIELPVVPSAPCQSFLRLTRLGKGFRLDPSFICAGGEPGIDTCTGDGGSPLACPSTSDPNRYVQAGIVAWGINCGADRTPGVYGNVAKARKWIDGKMAQWGLDTSSYVL